MRDPQRNDQRLPVGGGEAHPPSNPYAAPAVSEQAIRAEIEQKPPPSVLGAALQWTIICSAGAGPSFLAGSSFCKSPLDYFAMVLGVLIFVAAYTWISASRLWKLTSTVVRRSIMAAFWLRVVLTAIFPIAMMNDLLIGAISMNLMRRVFGTEMLNGFWQIALTTIIQGVLLNLEVWTVAMLLLACGGFYRSYAAHQASHDSAP